jgi:hypothetical protein
MKRVRVYFCSPYADAAHVRRLHRIAHARGLLPVSSWAETVSDGPERLESLPRRSVRALAERNDADLLSAHVLVVLAREGAGGEMFAEARLALAHGAPIVWVGTRRPLTAYREGVVRFQGVTAAFAFLSVFRAVGTAPALDDDDRRSLIWTCIERLAERARDHEAKREEAA